MNVQVGIRCFYNIFLFFLFLLFILFLNVKTSFLFLFFSNFRLHLLSYWNALPDTIVFQKIRIKQKCDVIFVLKRKYIYIYIYILLKFLFRIIHFKLQCIYKDFLFIYRLHLCMI